MIVLSRATSATDSIIASRTGPRSDRSPTPPPAPLPDRVGVDVTPSSCLDGCQDAHRRSAARDGSVQLVAADAARRRTVPVGVGGAALGHLGHARLVLLLAVPDHDRHPTAALAVHQP